MCPFTVWLLFLAAATADDFRIVHTRFGRIRGKEIETGGGQRGFIFTGIPLAKPPLNELRFQQAADPDQWEGVLDTFQYRNACLSEAKKTYKTYAGPVSEDCLYINVFTSRSCLESVGSSGQRVSVFQGGCAVIAYVHGGARNMESPVVFEPEVLVNNFANEERNVMIVSLPYRTGVLGWLNLSPGVKSSSDTNLGLRDCYFGLEWIQKEIRKLGGDPGRVTLMGHSSGGSQVQEIAISPRSKGLFNQVISMSGYSYGGDKTGIVNSKFSQKFARKAGCASPDEMFNSPRRVEQILACLRAISADKILETQLSFKEEPEEPYGTWIDGEILPDTMRNLMNKAPKMNCLVGSVSGEMRGLKTLVSAEGTVDMDLLEWVCDHVGYERNYENPEAFKRLCLDYYSNPNKTGRLEDDIMFYVFNGQIAEAFRGKTANSYVYSYEYTGAGPVYTKSVTKIKDAPAHTEDFLYIFGLHRNFSMFTDKDRKIEKIYSGIIANFVNTGSPSYEGQKWEPWNPERRNYFVIDFDKRFAMPGQKDDYYREAYDFWQDRVIAEAGDWSPLTDFPPEADMYVMNAVTNAKLSVELNKLRFIDKSIEAGQMILDAWERNLVHLKQKRKTALAVRSGVFFLTEDEARLRSYLYSKEAFIGLFIVLAGYCGIAYYLQNRKRQEYQVISESPLQNTEKAPLIE